MGDAHVGVSIAESLSIDDETAIAGLLAQLSSAIFDAARVRAMLEHDGTDLLLARESGRVVGMATLVTIHRSSQVADLARSPI